MVNSWRLALQGANSCSLVDARRAVSASVLRTPAPSVGIPRRGSGAPWKGLCALLPAAAAVSSSAQTPVPKLWCCQMRHVTSAAFNHNWGENGFMASSSLKTASIPKYWRSSVELACFCLLCGLFRWHRLQQLVWVCGRLFQVQHISIQTQRHPYNSKHFIPSTVLSQKHLSVHHVEQSLQLVLVHKTEEHLW